MTDTKTQFQALFAKIAKSENYLEPGYPRPNISRYTNGHWFAALTDEGYTRWVGMTNGTTVAWRVDEMYGKGYQFSGITEAEFNSLDLDQFPNLAVNEQPQEPKMEKKTVFAVYTNTDLTEGRGSETVKHYCELRSTAERLAKRGYVQGSDCPIKSVELINGGGLWFRYTPVRVETPTTLDRQVEELRLNEQRHQAEKFAAIQKARMLGLSDEEINAITGK